MMVLLGMMEVSLVMFLRNMVLKEMKILQL
jgi:hypothetical protein